MKPYAPYNAKIALSNQVKTDLLINIYQKNYYLENERFSTVDIKSKRRFIKVRRKYKRITKFSYSILGHYFDSYSSITYSQNDYIFNDIPYYPGYSYFLKPKKYLNRYAPSFDFKEASIVITEFNSFLSYFLKNVKIYNMKGNAFKNLMPVKVVKGGFVTFSLTRYIFLSTPKAIRLGQSALIRLFNNSKKSKMPTFTSGKNLLK
jgi:hypothetical protein